MHMLTATEASRSFATLLDEVEHGETVVITRGGKRIATIGPTPASNGAEFLAMMAAVEPDDDFAADVESARTLLTSEGNQWPAD